MSDNVSADELLQYIERAEHLDAEKKDLMDSIKEVFAEAKAVGFDTKTMKAIIRLRAMNPDDRVNAEALLETYKAALKLD
jgi:uncharacterized protein (UPF0335 family)